MNFLICAAAADGFGQDDAYSDKLCAIRVATSIQIQF